AVLAAQPPHRLRHGCTLPGHLGERPHRRAAGGCGCGVEPHGVRRASGGQSYRHGLPGIRHSVPLRLELLPFKLRRLRSLGCGAQGQPLPLRPACGRRNSATMDADGFLTPMATERSHHDAGVLFGDLQPGPEALLGFNSEDLSGRDVLEMKSACWACEGWQRQEISWTYQDEDRPKAVWAYTSLDAFRRPLRLHPDPGQQRFLAARMVPPGYRLKVIFQVDSTLQLLPGERERMSPEVMLRICQELPELSPDAEQIARTDASPRSGRTVFIASLPEVSVLARTESSPSSKNARGVVSDGPEGSVLLPRVTETEFKSQVKRSPPFWQGFKRETFAMHREALRVDWLRCRLGHVAVASECQTGGRGAVREQVAEVPESEIDDIKKERGDQENGGM
ncbi:unnamed protein product, partial [Effrenium voratum]